MVEYEHVVEYEHIVEHEHTVDHNVVDYEHVVENEHRSCTKPHNEALAQALQGSAEHVVRLTNMWMKDDQTIKQ